MKRFIIIITVSFLIGISWGGFGNPAYAYEDTYEKVWDSGSAISNPVYDVEVGDTDKDGDMDMVLHFKTQETGIQHGDTQACLTGKTFAGESIYGCDTIVTKSKQKK